MIFFVRDDIMNLSDKSRSTNETHTLQCMLNAYITIRICSFLGLILKRNYAFNKDTLQGINLIHVIKEG